MRPENLSGIEQEMGEIVVFQDRENSPSTTRMSQRHRVPSPFLDQMDSVGFGKITEPQMKAVLELLKAQGRLNSQKPPEPTGDRGIVMAAGGKYADWGYVNARWLRLRGVQLPIQIWHFGPKEFPAKSKKIFDKLGVELVDAYEVRSKHWHRSLKGWTLKQFSAMHAPWEEVASYDADCFAIADPNQVFDDPEYQDAGALFFSDIKPCRSSDWAYIFAAVRIPDNEMESGVFFWNRVKAWPGIRFTNWIGEHSEVWDKHIFGDKCRAYLGFGTTNTPFIQSTERRWMDWGIEQSWKGNVIANHSMAYKRGEHNAPDRLIPGLFEEWRSLIL